jgi:hypothetical protein
MSAQIAAQRTPQRPLVDERVCPICFSSLIRIFSFISPYTVFVFDPDAYLPKPNRALIYLGACMIAGIRLAREKQVNVRVIPTSHAIEESVELAHEVFNRVYRKVPEKMNR